MQDTSELEYINQLQIELILHSIIYYKLDNSIISDYAWQEMAHQLIGLKKSRWFLSSVEYQTFKDFNGNTGMHLCLPQYEPEAKDLLQVHIDWVKENYDE